MSQLGEPSRPLPPPRTVVIQIVDHATGKVVPSAAVELRVGARRISTRSDGDGRVHVAARETEVIELLSVADKITMSVRG